MSTVIRTNMSAVRAYNLMATNHSQSQKTLNKITKGMKIASVQDDSSAWSISERMRVRIRALDQAYQNTQNSSSMIRTAEGAVANILETLRTLKEKALNSANDSNTDEDRRVLQKEFNQLIDQVDDDVLIQFNNMYLINNSRNNSMYTTQSIYFNDSLSLETDSNTLFSEMKNRNGDSLGIKSTDRIIWSYISNTEGAWYGELKGSDTLSALTTSVQSVTTYQNEVEISFSADNPSWQDKSGRTVYSKPGIILQSSTAPDGGFYGFSGFSFTVLDTQGNVNAFATKDLQFTEIQRAESKTGDRSLSFQLGSEANQSTRIALTDMGTRSLGLKYWWYEEPSVGTSDPHFISISTQRDANAAVDVLDRAIKRVLDQQSSIGAFLSRLEYAAINLTVSSENVQSSESTIRDADMAKEMTNYTKANVLLQAAQAMLAQANQSSSSVLSLLQ